MKVLLIEDEIPAAKKLEKLLPFVDASIEITEICRTVESSVNWLKNNPPPELILMDIELTDGKSFEIFEQVKIVSPVIFVTAYNEYAVRAIKLHALDYLLKPVTKRMLEEGLKAVKAHAGIETEATLKLTELQSMINDLTSGKRPKRLALNSREGIIFISIDDILRLEADSNYTHIFLSTGKK